jgi:hypothetical protein
MTIHRNAPAAVNALMNENACRKGGFVADRLIELPPPQ